MVLVGVASFFIGSVLGATFRVWILIPATMFLLILLTGIHRAPGMEDVSVLMSLLAGWLALQSGFFCGSSVRRFRTHPSRAFTVNAH
jgi:hypothetical protein